MEWQGDTAFERQAAYDSVGIGRVRRDGQMTMSDPSRTSVDATSTRIP